MHNQNGHQNGPKTNAGLLRVLVVEDHADTADSTAWLLRLEGHQVRQAATGPEALAAVDAELPDVVLLDIGLPGLNGYEVARRLKGLAGDKSPLVIAVTGYGQEEDRRRSAQAGVDLHLVKPVDPVYLEGLLQRFRSVIL